MDFDEIEKIKTIVRAWSISEPKVKETYIFGSRLKGTCNNSSDIDIAVRVFSSEERLDNVGLVYHGAETVYKALEDSEDDTFEDLKAMLRTSIESFFKKHSINTKIHLTNVYAPYLDKAIKDSGLLLVYRKGYDFV